MKPLTAILISAPIFFGAVSLVNSFHKSSETIKTLKNENRYLLEKVHKKQEVRLNEKPLLPKKDVAALNQLYGWKEAMQTRNAEIPDFKSAIRKNNLLTKEQRSQAFNNYFKR